jgi:DNA-binding Xre family transcriptional regulator
MNPNKKTGGDSMVDYSPLWNTLKERGITQYYLLKNGIDNKTLDSLKKNKNITMLTLEKLCTIIDCTPNDVVRFIKE